MASITLKDIDTPLLERIKAQASRDKRSINRQILWLLEQVTTSGSHDPATEAMQQREAQLLAWQNLAGRWQGSREETDSIVVGIYQDRTEGREFSL